jgi:hypothetical protein
MSGTSLNSLCRFPFGSTMAERRGCSWLSSLAWITDPRRFFIGAGVTITDATAGCLRFLRPLLRQIFGPRQERQFGRAS